jgi:hypothetical protein
MWDVTYHIVDAAAFEQALHNVSLSLKPGGLFLVTDWFGASSDRRIADHVYVRCLDTYQRTLGAKGFELKDLYPLYNSLNKPHLGKADNYLAFLYFTVDTFRKRMPPDNLSLSVWRYNMPKN